ncbi:MAG: GTPase Era [Candidatus Roizmanbacteria bacterium]|nr:GTPase Era [Candidatus Roizmanbacteria bacterium]
MKKAGIVLMVGRPNVGKSTLLNNILGNKVSITSPKPQTTRFPIEAVYEDERGQLIFIDTPGLFKKANDRLAKIVNRRTTEALKGDYDMVMYVVDKTRHRSFEEGRVLGEIRKIKKPVILVINKDDMTGEDCTPEYVFMYDEVDAVHTVSALKRKHFKPLMERLFSYATRNYPIMNTSGMPTPSLNLTSRIYLQEIIREKIYLFTRQELPYKTGVKVDEIIERDNGVLYIHAIIFTTDVRYKKMLIGKDGYMITEIGRAARKEIETASNKKVYLDIIVEVDPNWQERLNE